MRQLNTQEILNVAGATGCAGTSSTSYKSPLQCLTDFFYFICQPKTPCAPAPKPTCAPKPSCGTPAPAPAPTPAPPAPDL